MLTEEPQCERAVREHGAIDTAGALETEHRIATPEPQQVAVQRDGVRVTLALRMIELAALEDSRVRRIGEARAHLRRGQAGKLCEEFRAAFLYEPRELGRVVGEEHEWARGGKLLPLKQHRRGRRQEQERGDRAPASGTR